MIFRYCKYCKAEFETENPNQIYCSTECRDKQNVSIRRYGGRHHDVLERDGFTCQTCGSKYDLVVHHLDHNVENNKMTNLITWCRHCHTSYHQRVELNVMYKDISRERVIKAIETTDNLEEAAEVLGITRKTLMNKRKEFGLPRLSCGRQGESNKHYVHISLNEIEMAYELEGTWVKTATRLGLSESFLRKRYKELKGLDKIVNRIYKDISKEEILNAYEEGGNWNNACKILGVSKKTLKLKRDKYGLS